MITVINDTVVQGLSQKCACKIFGIAPRKFRRWVNPKPIGLRTAWNKMLERERDAIEAATWETELIGKPISHIFVHGHESGKFFASLSTVYRVLKAKNMVEPRKHWQRRMPYVSAHALLDEGFSLLCYDGTQFKTDSGIIVWAIPVMILPQRYLLHIGHSINGISAGDLTQSVKEAYTLLPEHLTTKLVAHSDRGFAMKASSTKQIIKDLLGAPVHFGRPHTPDDQAWIEAFIKTLKYHRDAPRSFKLVDDILQWLNRVPDIYNNDSHSSLSYVTLLQALSGPKGGDLKSTKTKSCSSSYAALYWHGYFIPHIKCYYRGNISGFSKHIRQHLSFRNRYFMNIKNTGTMIYPIFYLIITNRFVPMAILEIIYLCPKMFQRRIQISHI